MGKHLVPLVCIALLVAACANTPTTVPTPTSTPTPLPTSTPLPTASPPPSPTDTPIPTPPPLATATPAPRTLTICMGGEPDTLFLYGGAMYAASIVREAIYDGPVDTRSFDFQPVILEKLPSLADGDAVLEPVPVQAGDLVVDNQGEVVPLAKGVVVRPTGCRRPECAVAYDGGPLEMDRLSATFRLLPGLRWSDGTPLTATDSAFSFQVAQGATVLFADGPAPAGQYGLVPAREVDPTPRTASYTTLDERTVQWVGLPGFLDPYYQTNFYTPLPEHQLGHLPADRLAEAPESARTPLGWGPYILKQWVPGQRIVAERNPHYFRAAEGLPYFDWLVFRFTGQDVERNLADLQAGRCDLLTLDTYLQTELDRVRQMEAVGAIKLYPTIATPWEHLSFGINPVPGYDRPDFFEDVRLRQAIARCVDRQQIVDQVYHDLTIVPHVYVPPSNPLYPDDGLGVYSFDPQAGTALLEDAGWRDADGDGVREAHGLAGIPDGTRLELRYETTSSETRAQIAALVAKDLATCGMAVTVIQTPLGEFFAEDPPGPLVGRRFDLVQFAWLSGAIPPCKLFLSSEIPSEANGWTGENFTGYSNPAYDAACRAAQEALPGSQEYITFHQEAMRLFFEDLPALPLVMRFNVSATRPDLRGLVVDPTHMAETWNLEEYRLEP